MAGGSEGGEKTEKPTPKKLQDAAKKGDILQSRELGTALVVMAGIGCLAVIGPSLIDALRDMLVEALRIRREDIVDFSPAKRGLDLLASIALPVAGVMLATFLAAIAAPALLGSLGFRPGAFAPKPEKLNPLSGLKRIFGMQGLIELLKSIAKVGLLGSIGVWLIWDRLAEITGLGKAGIALARVVYDEWIPMHNKFALVEAGADRSVIFGSFNWSRPSQRYNHEIGVIAHDLELFSAFAVRWDVLAEQVRVHEGAQ